MPCFMKKTTKSRLNKVYSFYLCQLIYLRPEAHYTLLLAFWCLSQVLSQVLSHGAAMVVVLGRLRLFE